VLRVEKEYLLLDHKALQPHVKFIVDVQAKMVPEYYLQGPWSEWASSAEQRTSGAAALVEGRGTFFILNQAVEAGYRMYSNVLRVLKQLNVSQTLKGKVLI